MFCVRVRVSSEKEMHYFKLISVSIILTTITERLSVSSFQLVFKAVCNTFNNLCESFSLYYVNIIRWNMLKSHFILTPV